MSTKANWPDGMTITNDGMVLYVTHNHLGLVKINGLDVTAMEYRARQICALPKMVELLKHITNPETGNMPPQLFKMATAILREIGEDE